MESMIPLNETPWYQQQIQLKEYVCELAALLINISGCRLTADEI
jgi:hypothetical protein